MSAMLKVFSMLCLTASTLVWAVDKGGTISSSETWSGTITLTSNVTINGGTVTIQPGTQISGSGRDIKIQGAGVVSAVGTAASRIMFSSTRFVIEALTRDLDCFFQYCELNRGNGCVLEFRNPSGVTELSTLKMDNVNFLNGGYTLMYVTSSGSPTLTNCHFENATSGIFCHGGDVVDVSYCSFTNVSQAIISGGIGDATHPAFYEPMLLKVNHCVFYDIDATRTQSGVEVAKGYAICSVNYPGTMQIRNSIFQNIAYSSIRDWNIEDSNFPVNWTVINDYNCHYLLGGEPFRLRSPGAHSLVDVNPQMKNPASGDYSLNSGSPCIGKASDGTDIGLSGGLISIFDNLMADGKKIPVAVSANPFKGAVELSTGLAGEFKVLIYNEAGTPVKQLHGTGSVTWDGRSFTGKHMPEGTYFGLIMSAEGNTLVRLVKAE